MSDKGATYTIVVNKKKEIVSVTYNGGPPMTQEGEGNPPPVPVVERDARGVPVDIDPPQGYSGCICLGEPIKDHRGTCVWKWGKLF